MHDAVLLKPVPKKRMLAAATSPDNE